MKQVFERGFRVSIETESALSGILNDMGEQGIKWRSGDLASEWSPISFQTLPIGLEIDTNGLLGYERVY